MMVGEKRMGRGRGEGMSIDRIDGEEVGSPSLSTIIFYPASHISLSFSSSSSYISIPYPASRPYPSPHPFFSSLRLPGPRLLTPSPPHSYLVDFPPKAQPPVITRT